MKNAHIKRQNWPNCHIYMGKGGRVQVKQKLQEQDELKYPPKPRPLPSLWIFLLQH